MIETPPLVRPIVVLDSDSHEGRSLHETLRASGHDYTMVTSFEGLLESLQAEAAVVALIAFEALWPSPQRALRQLRDQVPGARLILAYTEDGPRLSLGKRLWSVNLIDYWIPRSTPPHEMIPLMQQAHADALIERSSYELEAKRGDGQTATEVPLGQLEHLSYALNNTRDLDELMRVFHRKLYRLVEYQLLNVLLCGSQPYRLFRFPVVRIAQELMAYLTEASCSAVSPYLSEPLDPERVAIFDAPTLLDDVGQTNAGRQITLPMLLHGQLIGCLSVLPEEDRPLSGTQLAMLKLVTIHLASAIRNVEVLRASKDSSLSNSLTGLPNQRFLQSALHQEWMRVTRYNHKLSIVVLDIDGFDAINKREGYATGDEVLKGAAALLGQHLRETDQLVYLGDDRFLLLLAETGAGEASIVVERVRLAFKKRPVFDAGREGPIQITLSAGVASYPVCDATTPEDLVDLAARAVAAAKEAGRDQVIVASGQGFESLFDQTPAPHNKRRYPRIPSDLPVKYIELPDFEGHLTTSRSLNINARGVAIEDPHSRLRKHSYALVYVEDAQTPVLSRVVWTREQEEGRRSAGLEFLQSGDFDERVKLTQSQQAQPKALVVTDNPHTWVQVQRVLIAARYQIQIFKRGMEVPPPEELEGLALVVVGEQALRGWLGPNLDVLRSRLRPPARVVVMSESENKIEALETIAQHRIDHFVSSSDTSDAALFATLNKLLVGEYFGMQKYLLWGVTPKSWTIDRMEEKDEMLEQIRQVAQEVYCHPRVTDLLITAVDEMVINAMYHGISDSGGAQGHQVTVECGTDGRLFAVSVIDEEGTFLAEDLHRGLSLGLSRRSQGLPEDASSAGLGFRIMLDCLSQLAINAEAGRRTEVIGIVDLRKPFKEFRRFIPTLGVFDKKPAG